MVSHFFNPLHFHSNTSIERHNRDKSSRRIKASRFELTRIAGGQDSVLRQQKAGESCKLVCEKIASSSSGLVSNSTSSVYPDNQDVPNCEKKLLEKKGN